MEQGEPIFIGRLDTDYSLIVVMSSRLPKTDQMLVYHDIRVELADLRVLLIPADFLTDCHSTPPWSQSVLPAYDNKTNLAAIAHDKLYMDWEAFTVNYTELQAMSAKAARAYADGVYLELMERFNPGRFRNKLYYAGVRLFGWWNWRKFRSQAEKG
ncbi:DUF1353 domain-containing protein [Spirosoma litoris]